MAQLPEEVIVAISQEHEIGVLTTVDRKGVPNAAYMALRKVADGDKLVLGDAHLSKTRTNLLNGSSGSFLILDSSGKKSYQIKGRLEYLTSGPIFEDARSLATPGHPLVAAVVLHADEVYRGSDRLI